MQLSGLLALLHELPAYRALLAQPPAGPQALLQAARPTIVGGLKSHRPGALILLTARSEMAQQLADQLAHWLPPVERAVHPIPAYALTSKPAVCCANALRVGVVAIPQLSLPRLCRSARSEATKSSTSCI